MEWGSGEREGGGGERGQEHWTTACPTQSPSSGLVGLIISIYIYIYIYMTKKRLFDKNNAYERSCW